MANFRVRPIKRQEFILQHKQPRDTKIFRMILNFFKKSIVEGVLIVLPMLFIIWIFKIAISLSADLLEPFSRELLSLSLATEYKELIWFKITKFLILCLVVGIVYQIVSKLSFVKKVDSFFTREIPVYYYIKNMLFQFLQRDRLPFKEVVYVKMNERGDLALGFISENLSLDKCSVFIPTSPNPTTGTIRIIDKKDVYKSNLSFDKAISILITCGSGIGSNYYSSEASSLDIL